QLVAAGEKDAARLLEAGEAAALLAVAAGVEVHDRDAPRAEIAEHLLVARPGLVNAARGGDDDQVRPGAARDAHEALEDAPVVLLVLRTADGDDPSAATACWNPARHPLVTPNAQHCANAKIPRPRPARNRAAPDLLEQLERQPPLERARLVRRKAAHPHLKISTTLLDAERRAEGRRGHVIGVVADAVRGDRDGVAHRGPAEG